MPDLQSFQTRLDNYRVQMRDILRGRPMGSSGGMSMSERVMLKDYDAAITERRQRGMEQLRLTNDAIRQGLAARKDTDTGEWTFLDLPMDDNQRSAAMVFAEKKYISDAKNRAALLSAQTKESLDLLKQATDRLKTGDLRDRYAAMQMAITFDNTIAAITGKDWGFRKKVRDMAEIGDLEQNLDDSTINEMWEMVGKIRENPRNIQMISNYAAVYGGFKNEKARSQLPNPSELYKLYTEISNEDRKKHDEKVKEEKKKREEKFTATRVIPGEGRWETQATAEELPKLEGYRRGKFTPETGQLTDNSVMNLMSMLSADPQGMDKASRYWKHYQDLRKSMGPGDAFAQVAEEATELTLDDFQQLAGVSSGKMTRSQAVKIIVDSLGWSEERAHAWVTAQMGRNRRSK